MSIIVNNTDNSVLISGLFSNNQNQNTPTLSNISSLLGDYASIKNGSYAKLAKQYYSKVDNGDKSNSLNLNNNFAETKENQIKSGKLMVSDISSLRAAISRLSTSDKIYEDLTTTPTSEKSNTYDNINKKLKSFVDSYNSIIESGGNSNNSTILRNTLGMTNMTGYNSEQLEKVGITINSDNTLMLKENGINESNINDVKSLFGEKSGYIKSIDSYATNIASEAASQIYNLGGYSSGMYKQTIESIYNATI